VNVKVKEYSNFKKKSVKEVKNSESRRATFRDCKTLIVMSLFIFEVLCYAKRTTI
jgi:hypothetical protein